MRYTQLLPALLLSTSWALMGLLVAKADEPASPASLRLPGICGQIYGLTGRSVIVDGQLMRLTDYCSERQRLADPTAASSDNDPDRASSSETRLTPEATADDRFWQSFLAIANLDAERFATEAGQDDVITYGKTVCSILESGTSLPDLQRMQLEGGLPENFDTAINSAAINIYCPEYHQGRE